MGPHALDTNRAALAGTFGGKPLRLAHAGSKTALDSRADLALWAAGPRMAVFETEVLSGLRFIPGPVPQSFTLEFVDLTAKTYAGVPVTGLVRPTNPIFAKQLELVATYAELREDRSAEIIGQLHGGGPFWAAIVGLTAHRHKRTAELLDLAMSLATHVAMRFKHAMAVARPVYLSAQIQPCIPTPGHGSWPSGHATEAYMTCELLQKLLPNGARYKEQLQRLAARTAVNRTVAGVHYPVDSAVGRLLGISLAEFLEARCNPGTKIQQRGFDGTKFEGAKGSTLDFDPRTPMPTLRSQNNFYQVLGSKKLVAHSPLLAQLWTEAAKEW